MLYIHVLIYLYQCDYYSFIIRFGGRWVVLDAYTLTTDLFCRNYTKNAGNKKTTDSFKRRLFRTTLFV